MKAILVLVLLGIIAVCWLMANAFSKPILNRMHNYYEDDKDGRYIANIFIGVIAFISFLIGLLVT
jgi:hypothetical protein